MLSKGDLQDVRGVVVRKGDICLATLMKCVLVVCNRDFRIDVN